MPRPALRWLICALGVASACTIASTSAAMKLYETPENQERAFVGPDVNFRLDLAFGTSFPLSSSTYALGAAQGAETTWGLAVATGASLDLGWVSLRLGGELDVPTLDGQLFENTDASDITGGSRIALGLGAKIQPPGMGWQPFARVFGRLARMSSPSTENISCPADFDDDPLTDCPDGPPLDHVAYEGLSGGFAVGLAYVGITHMLVRGAWTLEMRYAFTRWGGVELTRASGRRQQRVEVNGADVLLGQGEPWLHQVSLLAGFEIDIIRWERREDVD